MQAAAPRLGRGLVGSASFLVVLVDSVGVPDHKDASFASTRSRRSAKSMRNKLGESLASIQKHDTPLEQATTSSLEALQAYSPAQRTWRSQGETAAIPLFKRALESDPNFAFTGMDFVRGGDMCGGIGVRLESGDFFEGLRVESTPEDGRHFRKKSQVVTLFPESLRVVIYVITSPCVGPADPHQSAGEVSARVLI